MGIYVTLGILPQQIESDRWTAVYDECVAMLARHPLRLAGRATREIDGQTLRYYSRDLELDRDDPAKRRWYVVGDLTTKRMAESFEIRRDLSAYRRGEEVEDILMLDRAKGAATPVLDAKTQGYPYHEAVLAAAMMVEAAFPQAALVGGDIDREQAQAASDRARELIGRALPLPIRVDAERLWRRLSQFATGDELLDRFAAQYLASGARVLPALLELASPPQVDAWFLRQLQHYDSARQLGVLRLMVHWLDADGDLARLLFLLCRHDGGPRYDPEEVARELGGLFIEATRKETEFLDFFRVEPGEVQSVWSQLRGLFFDMELMGRHLDRRFTPAEVDRAFASVFEAQGPGLVAVLRQRQQKRRQALGEGREAMPGFRRRAAADAEVDPEKLMSAGGPAELDAGLELMVETFVAAMWGLIEDARKEAEAGEDRTWLLADDLDELRRNLASFLARKGPILTEDAWEWIEVEDDAATLRFLLISAASVGRSEKVYATKRALFENRWLCRYALELMSDQARMQRAAETIAAIVEAAREGE